MSESHGSSLRERKMRLAGRCLGRRIDVLDASFWHVDPKNRVGTSLQNIAANITILRQNQRQTKYVLSFVQGGARLTRNCPRFVLPTVVLRQSVCSSSVTSNSMVVRVGIMFDLALLSVLPLPCTYYSMSWLAVNLRTQRDPNPRPLNNQSKLVTN